MTILKCDVVGCNTTLSTADEIDTGLCTAHRNLLLQRHSYAVVCWNCGNPTFVDDKPREKHRPIIKDKYIMSQSCPQCDSKSDGHRYMTIRPNEMSDVALGKDETLHLGADGLISGLPYPQSPKLRRSSETEDQEVDWTRLRAEAEQRAEDFLRDLETEG